MASLVLSNQYTLSDFKNKENSGNIPELESLVIEKINKLANRVGAPSYQKTPDLIFHNKQQFLEH